MRDVDALQVTLKSDLQRPQREIQQSRKHKRNFKANIASILRDRTRVPGRSHTGDDQSE